MPYAQTPPLFQTPLLELAVLFEKLCLETSVVPELADQFKPERLSLLTSLLHKMRVLCLIRQQQPQVAPPLSAVALMKHPLSVLNDEIVVPVASLHDTPGLAVLEHKQQRRVRGQRVLQTPWRASEFDHLKSVCN